jgi:hypothetical protein
LWAMNKIKNKKNRQSPSDRCVINLNFYFYQRKRCEKLIIF